MKTNPQETTPFDYEEAEPKFEAAIEKSAADTYKFPVKPAAFNNRYEELAFLNKNDEAMALRKAYADGAHLGVYLTREFYKAFASNQATTTKKTSDESFSGPSEEIITCYRTGPERNRTIYNWKDLQEIVSGLKNYGGLNVTAETLAIVLDFIDKWAHIEGLKLDMFMGLQGMETVFVFSPIDSL